jgi:hypothetical protein
MVRRALWRRGRLVCLVSVVNDEFARLDGTGGGVGAFGMVTVGSAAEPKKVLILVRLLSDDSYG